MREESPANRRGLRGLRVPAGIVGGWFALAAVFALTACVDTGMLFTETEAAQPAPRPPEANAADPGPGPTGAIDPGASPEVASPGTMGGASGPNPSEGEPPIDGVDRPPPPVAGSPDGPEPTDPGDSTEPPDPGAPSEPGSPPPPLEPDPSEARVCPELDQPLLLDFEGTENGTQAFFGDFTNVFSGGTFVYPERPAGGASGAPGGNAPGGNALGLTSDVTNGDWHVSGLVGAAAGFGLFFDCQSLDASRFDGIQFRIQGEIEGDRPLTLFVGSASNDVSREWLLEQGDTSAGPSFGRCTPAATRFDGSCQPARVVLEITSEGGEVTIPFSLLGGGSPEEGLNPAEITTVQWSLPASPQGGPGGGPYAVDLRIDDIRFVEAD